MINTEEEVTQCTGEIENNFSSRVEPHRVTVNQAGTRLPTGVEPEAIDVTVYYTRAEDLTPLHSPGCEATALLVQINSVNWTTVCSALTTARRLAIYHPNELKLVLDTVMPHLKLHIASLRSSVCKTALICATDFLKAFGELMFIHLQSGSPSLLAILLQKAALDKRFVMDEAKRTLSMMINAMPCKVLLNMLFLHVRDTNCKVRAIVAKYLTETVEKALCERERGIECCIDYNHEYLLQAVATFVNDRQPGARESARQLLSKLKDTYYHDTSSDEWFRFVERSLGKPTAIKILRTV